MFGGQLVDPDTGRLSTQCVGLAAQFLELLLESRHLARIVERKFEDLHLGDANCSTGTTGKTV